MKLLDRMSVAEYSVWMVLLQAEGIFRINAENSHEEHVRDQLNKGIVPADIDVHCLAGLIKVITHYPFPPFCFVSCCGYPSKAYKCKEAFAALHFDFSFWGMEEACENTKISLGISFCSKIQELWMWKETEIVLM
jgi:hypothetical protein